MADLNDLKSWIERDLIRYGTTPASVLMEPWKDDTSDSMHFSLFTDVNAYRFSARQGGEGYLGCIATSRKHRAGETWTRGNDLPDGKLSEETWLEILKAIVSYEMVRVSADPEQLADLWRREHAEQPVETAAA